MDILLPFCLAEGEVRDAVLFGAREFLEDVFVQKALDFRLVHAQMPPGQESGVFSLIRCLSETGRKDTFEACLSEECRERGRERMAGKAANQGSLLQM